ncbi:NAD-P-binding protein [Epithele typhae]|uniref:NAD-P-binding protein n=1 Tax=Epithele typhae TaxID=378194 RepID=UPI002007EDC9|nr:NAD-P-binding protein [Epithele typhae]KAH9931677.1 NAD-P-binding protein [Epithele typhae]
MPPFVLISPATRGLSLALARHTLRTTHHPVFATYRPSPTTRSASHSDEPRSPESVRAHILRPLAREQVDRSRLHVLPLDLLSEDSIATAAADLSRTLSSLQSPPRTSLSQRQPADLDLATIDETFRLNVISHLLLIKHFSRFLPPPSVGRASEEAALAKWVHVSARVGSVSDNRLGGWYSYRASKAALNQVVRTFDLHLQAKRVPAIWVPAEKLLEPEDVAAKLVGVVEKLGTAERGRIWDWKGDEVPP